MAVASVLSALLLSILPTLNPLVIALDDSTNTNTIVLPFPSPDSFGNSSKACIFYNSSAKRYTMFVLTYTAAPFVGNDDCIEMNVLLFSNSGKTDFNHANIVIRALPYNEFTPTSTQEDIITLATNVHLYSYMWLSGSSSYSVSERSLTSISGRAVPTTICFDFETGDCDSWQYSAGSSSLPYNNPLNYVRAYNGCYVDTVVSSNIFYTFSSTDGYQSLAVLRGIDTNVNSIDSNVSDISDKLSASNYHLSNINNNVVFYCQEILDKLNDGSDYTPEQTTSNADMSNYEQAEGALMDDNIDKLNNIEMPDLNNFNSGSQNNAFKFISSNIEFFSGMNGTGSISKIATVLVVILGLGLASFIIGLSNRKKGG